MPIAMKDPNDRMRHEAKSRKVVSRPEVEKGVQPPLQEILGDNNPLTGKPWNYASLLMWKQFETWPSTENLRPLQWSMLARAMMIDDAFVSGVFKVAGEHYRFFTKWGITPQDLAKLRIFIAEPKDEDDGLGGLVGDAYERFGNLTLVEGSGTEG